jgi:hypothetical protein
MLKDDYGHGQGKCECNHPMGYYPGGKPLHVRKGMEYSTTCFLCHCQHAVEKRGDIRVPEKPPEIMSVMDMIKDKGD